MARKKIVVREGAKVYSYVRVSTEMQVERYSLKAQRDRIAEEAERYDMTIVREYADEGISGKNAADRPAFLQMMDDIANSTDDVSFVICFKLSRFGRKTSEILRYIEQMKDYGVHLICIDDNIDTSSDTGKIMVSILSIVSEIERENILSQTMEGRARKAREGKWNGGICPFGYEVGDDEKLEVVPSEAEIVKIIFKKFTATTMEQTSVAKWLNDVGYKKELKRPHERSYFTPRFITRVLRNPVYKGDMAYGKTTAAPRKDSPKYREKAEEKDIHFGRGAHEAIVSEEMWQAAQDKLDGKSGMPERREKDHEYLLGSLLRCPKCGKTMYGRPGKGAGVNKHGQPYPTYYSYMCRKSSNRVMLEEERCDFGQIACHKIDSQVRTVLLNLVNGENFAQTMEELAKEKVDTEEVENRIEMLNVELRKALFLRDKLELKQMQIPQDRFFDENYDRIERQLSKIYADVAGIREKIESAEDQLEAIRKTALTKEKIYEGLLLFNKIYDKISDYEKKKLLRSFIEKIEIYPEKNRKNGCYIKSIDFLFPVFYDGRKVYQIRVPEDCPFSALSESHVETIVLMSAEKPDAYIPIHLDVEKLGELTYYPEPNEQKEDKPQSAKLQTFGTATYSEIKKYCLEVHGLKVHSAHIAELKSKYGIKERKNYYLPKEGSQTRKYQCTAERKAAILDAFKHFGMI